MARNLFVFCLLLIAVLLRISGILPDNVSPVAAIALFGGALFSNKIQGILIPLGIMFLSDLYIGLHDLMIPVYAGFVIIGLIGLSIRKNPSIGRGLGGALVGSIIFFLITNAAVWMTTTYYAANIGGLLDCFLSGLPFFRNTLIGNLVFTAIFFGAFHAAAFRFPKLAKA